MMLSLQSVFSGASLAQVCDSRQPRPCGAPCRNAAEDVEVIDVARKIGFRHQIVTCGFESLPQV